MDVPSSLDTGLALILFGAVAFTLTKFAKLCLSKDWRGALTMFVVFLVGLASVALVATSEFGHDFALYGVRLSQASFGTLCLVALVPSSFGVVLADTHAAIDNTRSSKQPPLVKAKDDYAAVAQKPLGAADLDKLHGLDK